MQSLTLVSSIGLASMSSLQFFPAGVPLSPTFICQMTVTEFDDDDLLKGRYGIAF